MWLKPRGLDVLMEKPAPANIKAYFDTLTRSVLTRLEQEESDERNSVESGRKDMLHFIFKARNEGKVNLPHEILLEEKNMLIIGGTDTTSHTITALFIYLSYYPRVYNKVIKEIRSVFDCLDDIKTGPKLSSCTYFQAAIMEALRMSAPGSTEHPREVLPGGLTVGNAHFPVGTIDGSPSYAIHHSVIHYVDPFVFRPERWIVGDEVTAEDVACAESVFYGFSLGPRGFQKRR